MTEKPVRIPGSVWLATLLFWLANLAFLLRFADRDGYEGDDLNMLVPTAHLEAAKQGALLVYRYAWQPLSFEISSWIWAALGTPTTVFLSVAVGGACTVALLLLWLWREGAGRPGALAHAFIALLTVPELWYSSLYYNTTVRAMPLLVVALLLVRGQGRVAAPLAAGVLAGLAILMRLDFILVCPLLALAAWPRGTSLLRPVLLAAAVVATLAVGFAVGLIDVPEIMRISAFNGWEIAKNAHMPGWDMRLKVGVISVALSPVGWLLLAAGIILLPRDAWRRRDWRALAWAAAALPPVYPLPDILSPKYLLPLAPFAMLFFLRTQEAIAAHLSPVLRRWTAGALWAVAILPWFLSVSLFGKPPFLAVALAPERPVPTHDGARGWGGYLWQMMALDGPASRSSGQIAADKLAREIFAEPARNIVYIGCENYFDPGAVGWRHLQLQLQQRGNIGSAIAPDTLRFDLGNGHWLILAKTLPAGLVAGDYRLIDALEGKRAAEVCTVETIAETPRKP